MKKRLCVRPWLFSYKPDTNREVWDSKICHLISFISLKKVLHCDLITSNSKMPLVDSSEDGERYSFRLRRIGIPATYPGIGNTFKWVGTAELSCFNTVHVLRKHTRTVGSLNRSRSKLRVCDRRSVVFMRSHVKDLCMRIIQLVLTLNDDFHSGCRNVSQYSGQYLVSISDTSPFQECFYTEDQNIRSVEIHL